MLHFLFITIAFPVAGLIAFYVTSALIAQKDPGTPSFEIFAKGNRRRITVSVTPRHNRTIGLTFTLLSVLSFPIFAWRYGILVATLFVVAPFIPVAAYSIFIPHSSHDDAVMLTIYPLIGIVGALASRTDAMFRRRQLLRRQWTRLEAPDAHLTKSSLN